MFNVNKGGKHFCYNYCSLHVLGHALRGYSNWMSNSPSNETSMCVALASRFSWQWAEENCNAAYPYICETGLVSHLP